MGMDFVDDLLKIAGVTPSIDAEGHLQIDVVSGGAGTEFTEDEATPAAISGIALMIERDDALATLTPVG